MTGQEETKICPIMSGGTLTADGLVAEIVCQKEKCAL